ncbi:MAG: DUF805 domain-containing protein [Clostridia bacterium]|nr:DUF805 domain-containing protein [Clostridia bacterium]
MSFVDAIKTCFQKYADFSGRARRSEYWNFYLFNALVSGAAGAIFGADSIITSIISLALLIPGLAVAWRRMHDIGKSGAWNFIALIPLVGTILVIIWMCKDSVPGTNAYGTNPKE